MTKLTPSQQAVLDTLQHYGPLPDHALVPIVQHVQNKHFSSSRIRTARRELERGKRVSDTGNSVKMPSGRHASIFQAGR